MIKLTDVMNHREVFVVEFYDGYVEGEKYSVVPKDTTYMSFTASYGTKYFINYNEARILAEKLNEGKENE